MLNHKQCFDVLLVNCTAESLAKQVSEENYKNGLIYPPFSNIRKISANIAANVAAKAYELGVCSFSLTLYSSKSQSQAFVYI